MLTVKTIVENTFSKWGEAISAEVGYNYSMENSSVINSLPYASLYFIGLPGNSYDLEGDEGTVMPTLQVDIYTNGQRALTKAYEIDAVSHETLVREMGYRRTAGPELIQSTDPSIKRLVSRYSRVVGFGDTI